jgi:polyhydroxyalkanoate synthesis repressor PhaR
MPILIKRYANRKLYNTETSRYITLKGIAKLLDEGEEVRVIDNESGDDITQVALSQILVDNQRSKEDPSDTLLTQILSRGGDALYDAIRKSVDDATEGLGEFQDRFRQFVKDSESIARGERNFDWGSRPQGERRSPFAATPPDEAGPTETSRRAEGRDTSEPPGLIGRLLQARAAEETRELTAALERALRQGFEEADLPRADDLDRLNQNLERVAESVDRLEATLRERKSDLD